MADPKKGTGKKPKGSGRRLYTDENPRDTVPIKFATPADARRTVAKVKKVNKPFARKIQILTVVEQRAKVAGKPQQAARCVRQSCTRGVDARTRPSHALHHQRRITKRQHHHFGIPPPLPTESPTGKAAARPPPRRNTSRPCSRRTWCCRADPGTCPPRSARSSPA